MSDISDIIDKPVKAKKEKPAAPTPTYYVLHGDDEFSRKAEVATFLSRMGNSPEAAMNTARLDGTQTTVPMVLAAVRAMPFLSDKRLVIVDGLLTHLVRKGAGKTGSESLELLIAALPMLPDWSRLVLHEPGKLSTSHPIFKLLQADSRGFHKEFPVMDGRDLAAWIARKVAAEQGAIEPKAAEELALLVGPDLRALETEIFKLALYVNNERPIKVEDVHLLVSGSTEVKIWDMTDAIGARNGRQAIRVLHQLLDSAQEPLIILGSINRQFRLLLQVKSHLAEGGDLRELARLWNMKEYPVQKIAEQSKKFTIEQLERIYHHQLEIDLQIKTGKINDVVALDMLIADLTN